LKSRTWKVRVPPDFPLCANFLPLSKFKKNRK
jgi:hypothetical protein